MFQHLILGLLRDGKPRHAFALAKESERLSGNSGYPANASRGLRRLEHDGLVTREVNAPGEDERRIPYGITAKGCAVFDAWLVAPEALEDFSTWLLFADRLSPTIRDRLLDGHEEELWHLLKSVNRRREHALACGGHNGDGHFSADVAQLRWRIAQLSASLEFVRELRKELTDRSEDDR